MLRLLHSLLLALALSFSSVAMAGSVGMMMPHGAVAQAAGSENHCGGSEMPAENEQAGGEMNCAGTCAAFPAIPPCISEMASRPVAEVIRIRHQVLIGVQPERVTPPPRMTPEV